MHRAAKDPWQKTFERDGSPHGEQTDRLVLSALKYWEIRRDLIEERLAAIRKLTLKNGVWAQSEKHRSNNRRQNCS